MWYVDHQSLWLDVKIIGLTMCQVLKREGISQPGQATMEEFAVNHVLRTRYLSLGPRIADLREYGGWTGSGCCALLGGPRGWNVCRRARAVQFSA